MANFQVLDAYGSVITIQSSTFGTAERQIVGASIIGTLPATISGTPSISGTVNIAGAASVLVLNPVSVLAVTQSGAWSASLVGTIAGSVVAFQGGTQVTSLVSTIPSSVIVGASIFGQLPAGTAVLGSVVTLQGTNPWVIVGSVYGVGSVVAFQGGAWAQSIVGVIAPTTAVTSLASSTTNGTILASNTARKGATIANVSATSIMVKLGTTATALDYSVLMQDTDYYEVPANYSGRIDVIASSTAGIIRITEITG